MTMMKIEINKAYLWDCEHIVSDVHNLIDSKLLSETFLEKCNEGKRRRFISTSLHFLCNIFI